LYTVFPPTEALGSNIYDPKGKGKVVTASSGLAANQIQGLNLAGASGSGSDAP